METPSNTNHKIQIVALTTTGFNLIWDEMERDFVAYETEVVDTDLEDLKFARICAEKYYPGIKYVWAEIIDVETAQLIEVVK